MRFRIQVNGIQGISCVAKISDVLYGVSGVAAVMVDRVKSSVEVEGDVSLDILLEALDEAGYPSYEIKPISTSESIVSSPNWMMGTCLALVAMVILMFGEWVFGWDLQVWFIWFSLVLSLLVLLGPGQSFFRNAWGLALHGQSNMDTLVSIGSGAAWVLSVCELLRIGNLHHLYFLESTSIIALVSLGHTLENITTRRAASALRDLLKVVPARAFQLDSTGKMSEVKVKSLKIGDRIAISPGDLVPVDGVVTGTAIIDESMLTGESTPIQKQAGEMIFGGTMNLERLIQLEVRAVGEATAMGRINQLVREAQQSRSTIQKLADFLSSLLVTGVMILAVLTVLGWVFFGQTAWEQAIIYAVSVLVVACPCAMGLATPAALMVSVGVAIERGVLIRGANALEKSGRITAVLFDKTGTLTDSFGMLAVVRQLQRQGLNVFMVTGDHLSTTVDLAREVGIPLENVLTDFRPEEKASAVKQLQKRGERVAFVGDGNNDAPALAQADLGLAVMGASNLACEAADIILLSRDLEAVPEVLALSTATMRIIYQNFFWAMAYNGAAIPLAMAGVLPPTLCAAAMGLSDLCVVGNSLRLLHWKPRGHGKSKK